MKHLIFKSNFDFQNQRVFFIKTLVKKKSKLKYMYLFSKRKVSVVYAKPQHLEFTRLLNFNRGGTLCKQKNFFLQGFTGLPISNIILRYKYFDFTNVFDGIHFHDSYIFDIYGRFRKNYNFFFLKKFGLKSKSLFYFSHVLYSFKDFDFVLDTKNFFVNKKISLYLLKNEISYVFYLVFFRTVYKKYLLYLNSQFLKLKKYINMSFLNFKLGFLIDLLHLSLHSIIKLKKIGFYFKKYTILNSIKMSRIPYNNCKKLCKQYSFFNFNKKLKKRNLHLRIFCSFIKNFSVNSMQNYSYIYSCCYLTIVPFCLNYLNNTINFIFYLGMLFKMYLKQNIFFLHTKYLAVMLKRYISKHKFLSFKWRRKKKNLYKFFFLRRHYTVNHKGFTHFFFKNFLLYNEKYFKKYWKYFFGKKITIWKKLKKKNKRKVRLKNKQPVGLCYNYFYGFVDTKKRGNYINWLLSLYYFFSLFLNAKSWFYFYKTYMPTLYFKYVSSSTLDVNFKFNFFSWFKRRNVFSAYTQKLISLNLKNKYLYLVFYNYLFFKQLAGLKVFNKLNTFYLTKAIYISTDYVYSYIDLTFTELSTSLILNKTSTIVSLKKNRVNFFKNLLNVNLNFNKFGGYSKYLLYDFYNNAPLILCKYFWQKSTNLFNSFILKSSSYVILQQYQIYCFFFFKLLSKILKRVLFLKYLYHCFILRGNFLSLLNLSKFSTNSKFIFDFFFLLFSNYVILLKMLIIFLKFKK